MAGKLEKKKPNRPLPPPNFVESWLLYLLHVQPHAV
jgi:hypothetical protein